MSVSEFTQSPSRALRMADEGDLIILRREIPTYKLVRLHPRPVDPIDAADAAID